MYPWLPVTRTRIAPRTLRTRDGSARPAISPFPPEPVDRASKPFVARRCWHPAELSARFFHTSYALRLERPIRECANERLDISTEALADLGDKVAGRNE